MKRDAAEILKEALALPSEVRAALAGSLLESLDTEVDEDAEAAWAAEVNRLEGGELGRRDKETPRRPQVRYSEPDDLIAFGERERIQFD